jgi:hypothetical protein
MIRKNKIEELFETYSGPDTQDSDITDECLKEIKKIAEKDPIEFKNLIELFNKLEDEFEKLFLSDVLIDLGYDKVKDFLIKVTKEGEDLTDKIWAAGNLLKLEDVFAVTVLKDLVNKVDENDLYWLLEVIGRANNLTSIKLALELANKYKKLNKLIDKKYFEEKLAQYKK